ncbi:MAG TPA: hypothetical protein PKN04_02255 [bacterium]|jgi:hypothetical protein|nr:hypothetical protein [bacterium]HNT64584.1 hypothetical protein [bacterium]HOX84573.1 hypothetical protein [bacterium]HPG45296.1 hypothetical protein [bacterium]HPM98985.1 hypothetical protein [bacterium]
MWIFWPFRALWRLLTSLLKLVGRLAILLIGLSLCIVGCLVSFTVIGAVIGVPLAATGFLLMARGLF